MLQFLTPELNLCAGVGMSEDEREAWLMAACQKLNQWKVTEAILRSALAAIAVDHPAKILPAIKAYLGDWKNVYHAQPEIIPPSHRLENDNPLTEEELAKTPLHILKLGLAAGHLTQEQFDAAHSPSQSTLIE